MDVFIMITIMLLPRPRPAHYQQWEVNASVLHKYCKIHKLEPAGRQLALAIATPAKRRRKSEVAARCMPPP